MNSIERKICIKNIYKNYKFRRSLYSRKYRKKYPCQIKAGNKLRYVFDNSYLSDNNFICAICGKQPIEKHHENYDLPFVFIPLCLKCHGKTRKNLS